jgi:hypothetical protein
VGRAFPNVVTGSTESQRITGRVALLACLLVAGCGESSRRGAPKASRGGGAGAGGVAGASVAGRGADSTAGGASAGITGAGGLGAAGGAAAGANGDGGGVGSDAGGGAGEGGEAGDGAGAPTGSGGMTAGLGGASAGGGVTSVSDCPAGACRDRGACIESGRWTHCVCEAVAQLPPCDELRFRVIARVYGTGANSPPGSHGASVQTLTGDGSTALGSLFYDTERAATWTLEAGFLPLDPPVQGNANAIFAVPDGSMIVGHTDFDADRRVFVWQASGVEYRRVPGPVAAISADGRVFAGNSLDGSRGYLLTVGEAPLMLDAGANVSGLSADGKHVIGIKDDESFHFTVAGGLVPLPRTGGNSSVPTMVSPDGSLILGVLIGEPGGDQPIAWLANEEVTPDVLEVPYGVPYTYANWDFSAATGAGVLDGSISEAVVWNQGIGWRTVSEVLTDAGTDMSAWYLEHGVAVSTDGKTVVGLGRSIANNDYYWWIASLP